MHQAFLQRGHGRRARRHGRFDRLPARLSAPENLGGESGMSEDLIQGSAEWLAIRCGKVTASRVSDVVARTKAGWGASRANYAAELIAERLTQAPAERYQNAAMQWGTDNEPAARAAY